MTHDMQRIISGRTKVRLDHDENGHPVLHITLCEITPFMAKLAVTLSDLYTVVAVFAIFYGFYIYKSDDALTLLLLITGAVASGTLVKASFKELLRSRKQLTMSQTEIAFICQKGYMRFNRLQKHKFSARRHDLEDAEKRVLARLTAQDQQQKRVRTRTPYYQDSRIIVLSYMGQRHDLMAVHGIQNAADVIAALTYCDDELTKSQTTQKSPHHNETDWPDMQGGL